MEAALQQYITPFATWFAALFSPAEWKAFFLLIAVTLAATHTLKIAWRLSPYRGGSHGHVYLVTAFIGFASAPFVWPPGFSWWIPAVLAGPTAAMTFKVVFFFIKKFAPGLANTLNADRRKLDMGPPGGFARRTADKEDE